jgi:hypothetical protein
MQVDKKTIETVTLDESDIIQAIVLLLREKGYQHIKAEDVIIDPNQVTARCTIENTNKTT